MGKSAPPLKPKRTPGAPCARSAPGMLRTAQKRRYLENRNRFMGTSRTIPARSRERERRCKRCAWKGVVSFELSAFAFGLGGGKGTVIGVGAAMVYYLV